VKIIGAVDIGGTKIAVGAARQDGEIIFRAECPTRAKFGFAAAMDRIKAMLREAASRTKGEFDGIGVACPGPLDRSTGVIGLVGTLAGWEGGNLVAALKTEFPVRIAVENDADAATLAAATCEPGKGSSRLIYITVSTGIGAGILFDGHLYRGFCDVHPEIGHQIIDASSGSSCYCKATGCWESLASGEAIAAWVQEQRPARVPITAAEICHLAERGDQLALKAMDREGYYLGIGLANLITVFAPDTIVLGGGVMKSSHLFVPRTLQTIRKMCTQVPAENTKIRIVDFKSDIGLVGAAQVWLSQYGPRLGDTHTVSIRDQRVAPGSTSSSGPN
jgi:glucokinase